MTDTEEKIIEALQKRHNPDVCFDTLPCISCCGVGLIRKLDNQLAVLQMKYDSQLAEVERLARELARVAL